MGRVALVGAGPGDPELMTVKAVGALQRAEAVVHDRLVSSQILALAPSAARLISVGKRPKHHPVPQGEINRLLVDLARQGLEVVRLKGGDPFVFGRGGEELEALHAAGIAVEIVPGITSAQAAAASIGVPLTERGLVTGLRFVTGHCRSDAPLDFDWAGLADPNTTLVIYMGAANIAEIATRLMAHGMPGDMAVAAVASASLPRERRVLSHLAAIAADTRAARLCGPVLFIIGRVVALYPACPVERLVLSAELREELDA